MVAKPDIVRGSAALLSSLVLGLALAACQQEGGEERSVAETSGSTPGGALMQDLNPLPGP